MAILARKPCDLVFNGWAVPRPHPFDDTGVHRWKAIPRRIFHGFGRWYAYPAADLRRGMISTSGKRRNRVITSLLDHIA